MVRTRVGYTGGTLAHPTYRRLGDHTEAIQLDFDPERVSFGELLDLFWSSHAPDHPPYKRQYMSAIWPANEAQMRVAKQSLERQAEKLGARVYTEVAPLGVFTRAEDYHQKYYLRNLRNLMPAFAGYSDAEFEDSRVAARLNGVVGRYAEPSLIEAELPSYGLQPELAERVRALAGPRRRLP